MKHVVKKPKYEPGALFLYRQTPGSSYAGYVDKDLVSGEDKPLKKALAKEQYFICCYCLRRISIQEMSVEHYITQNHHPSSPLSASDHSNQTLSYHNMLGSCNSKIRTCSGIRGNTWLSVDPRQSQVESIVRFDKNGIVFSLNPVIQKEIRDVLKLNSDELRESRRAVIEFAKDRLLKRNPSGTWTFSLIYREIDFWLKPFKGKNGEMVYREYCLAAVHYLRSKIQKAQ